MQKLTLTVALFILAALMRCSSPTQAPEEPRPIATTTLTQAQPTSPAPSPTAAVPNRRRPHNADEATSHRIPAGSHTIPDSGAGRRHSIGCDRSPVAGRS